MVSRAAPLRALWVGALCSACATLPAAHIRAVQLHDRGIEYLSLALEAPTDSEKRRLCEQAAESCRLALEYDDRFAHGYDCLGTIELNCSRDLDRAAASFKKAIARNPDFAEAHNNLGVTFLRRTPPDYATAIGEFQAALEIDPGFANARENLALAHLRQGTILGDRGDDPARARHYRLARSHLIRLLELDPTNAEAHHNLGFMSLETGRRAEAEHHFQRCLELAPDHPLCHYHFGNLLLTAARYDEAILQYVAVLRSKTKSDVAVAARQNLEVAYERSAKRDGALRKALDRMATKPGDPMVHVDLGDLFADRGLFHEAKREWRQAARLAPDYCPTYHRLAMAAHRELRTPGAVQWCREVLQCAVRTRKEGHAAAMVQCTDLIDALTGPSPSSRFSMRRSGRESLPPSGP